MIRHDRIAGRHGQEASSIVKRGGLQRVSKLAAVAAVAGLTFATSALAENDWEAQVRLLAEQKVAVGTQLAIASKTLADEQFIDGDREAARRSYAIAAGAVLQALANPSLVTQESAEALSLLQRDIAYRTVLIDANLPFWGLEFTSTADVPVLQMNELEGLSVKLVALNNELRTFVDLLKGYDLAKLKVESERRRQEVQEAIGQLEQTQGEVNTEFHAKARTEAYRRVARLQTLEVELVKQQRDADVGIKALEKKNQQMVLDGLSAAAGIPPDVGKSIASGNINEALRQAATSYAGSAEFTELLNKANGVAPAMGKLYEEAKTLADSAKQDFELARKISNSVREPSLDNLAALGTRLVDRMPADQKAALKKAVLDSKPVGLLLSSAKREGAILDALGRKIAGQGGAVIGEAVGRLAKEHADLRVWYHDVLKQVTQVSVVSAPLSAVIVDQVFKDWSKGFVRLLPPAAVTALRTHLSVSFSDDLVRVLAERGASALPPFSLSAGRLQIPSLTVSVDVAAQLWSMAPVDLPAIDVPGIQGRFATLLAAGDGGIMKYVLMGTSLHGLESATAVASAGRTSNDVFDGVFSALDINAQAEVATAMAEIEAGRQLAHAQVEAVGAGGASAMLRVSTKTATANDIDVAKQLLAGPLAAAFPGAAAAVKVAEYIKGNLDMSTLSEQAQKASDQLNNYVDEEMHLRRLIEQSQTSEELARIDTDIAKLHRKQATSDIKYLKAVADVLAETEDDLRRKILGYRMSHFFYIAEEMRLRYAQLSRSLSLWLGAAPGPRDFIQTQMRNDPRGLRLAIDPYVRAFDVYEKDQQRQRQDIDQLASFWDFLVTQLRTFCSSLNNGCSRITPSLGTIGQTEEISLRSALPWEWVEFKQWQTARKNEPFSFALLVRPGLHNFETASKSLGMRVVQAFLTRNRPGVSDEPASSISVTHSGLSFIPTPGGFVSEVLLPETKYGLDPISKMKDKDVYATRWGQGPIGRHDFEGHGLFTVWMINVAAAQQNYELEDIKMRFVYQYVETSTLPLSLANLNEKAVEILAAESGVPIRMKLTSLVMLGDRIVLDRYVNEWQRGMGSAAFIKWQHGQFGSLAAHPANYDTGLLRNAAAILGDK